MSIISRVNEELQWRAFLSVRKKEIFIPCAIAAILVIGGIIAALFATHIPLNVSISVTVALVSVYAVVMLAFFLLNRAYLNSQKESQRTKKTFRGPLEDEHRLPDDWKKQLQQLNATKARQNENNHKTNAVAKETSKPFNIQNAKIYGRDAWRAWNIEILDSIPDAPLIDWCAMDPYFKEPFWKNYVLLYIPQRIRVHGQDMNLTLKAIEDSRGRPYIDYGHPIADKCALGKFYGWLLVSVKNIPDSQIKDWKTKKKMVETQKDFRMLHTIEAVALHFILEKFHKEVLDSFFMIESTICIEKLDGKYPVKVGSAPALGEFPSELKVYCEKSKTDYTGVSCGLQKF